MPPAIRVKGKAVSDNAVGWVTLKGQNVRPWSPYYTCKKVTEMHDTLAVEGAKELRKMAVGEVVELVEGPTKADNMTRIKARVEKEGIVGWVTIKDAEGGKIFE